MNKHFLFVTDHGGKWGGAERSLFYLAKYALQRRYRVTLVVFNDGEWTSSLRELGVEIYSCPLPYIERPVTFLNFFKYFMGIIRFLFLASKINKRQHFAAVYSNKSVTIIYSIMAALWFRIPCIWHVRNLNSNLGKVGKWLVKKCKAVIFNSNFTKQPFAKVCGDLEKFHVIYNGIEPVRAPKVVSKVKNIAMIAHFAPWKEHEVFLEAMKAIVKEFSDLNVYLYGDVLAANPKERERRKEYFDSLVQRVNDWGLESKIHFGGYKSSQDELYENVDLLIHPCRKEPFGRIVIEALSRGIPVIVPNEGGGAEILEKVGGGWKFSAGCPDQLVKLVREVICDESSLKMISVNSPSRVAQNFSNHIYVEEVLKCF